MKQLICNSVTCLECGEILISYSVHDYKTCKCEQATMVDGGLEYGRYGGKDITRIQTNYIYDDSPFENIREYLCRGGRGKDGTEELKYVRLKDLNDEWLVALIEFEETHRPENRYLPYYKQEKKYREINKITVE